MTDAAVPSAPSTAARIASRAATALFLGGAAVTLWAAATPAKAWLGQQLLERAWSAGQTARAEGAAAAENWVRPWPWADTGPIAKLSFPSLGESRLVLSRADGEGMAWGPGHVAGTAPLGAPGVSAAGAHRDTHFALLADLKPGDEIRLETLDGATARYRVARAQVVDARNWRFPAVFEGPDVLALSTCWPFDALTPGPERFILFAYRLDGAAS